MEQKSELKHHPYELLKFIVRYKRACDGNSPTYRDIMRGCRLASSSMVHRYLRKLAHQGHIRLVGNRRSRSIVVVGGTWVAPAEAQQRPRDEELT